MDYFVFSDIHGHGELFDKIMSWLNGRSEPWKCIFLGDACDRMPDGYRIMETLLNDERFIYLKGNHEDMFVKAARALREYWEAENLTYDKIAANPCAAITDYSWDRDVDLCLYNGGASTLIDWVKDGKSGLKIVNELDALPEHMELPHDIWGILDLSHAGHSKDNSDDMLWSRQHFLEKWTGGRMIHGHTPVRNVKKMACADGAHKDTRPLFYNDGTKVCIDTACFSTNMITLLNLKTFEQHTFTV